MKYMKLFTEGKEVVETKTFAFPKKRIHKTTDKSYVILNRGYQGRFFNIPKSQVIKTETISTRPGIHDDPIFKMEVTKYIWDKIGKDIESIDGIKFE